MALVDARPTGRPRADDRPELPPEVRDAHAAAQKHVRLPWAVRLGLRRPVRVDLAADEYKPGRLTRWLLWCGAVDRDLLYTRLEYYRYLNLGVFVCLVAILSGFSLTLYLSIIRGTFTPWYLVPAAAWVVLIFFLDRSIVAEPSYGDLRLSRFPVRRPGPDGDDAVPRLRAGDVPGVLSLKLAKGLAYVFRIVVAVLVAYLVGEAILLTIFAPEIRDQMNIQHDRQYQEAVVENRELVAAGTAHIRAEIGALEADRAKLVTELDDAKAERDRSNAILEAEGRGDGVREPGFGDQAEAAQADIRKRQATIDDKEAKIAALDPQIAAKRAQLDTENAGSPEVRAQLEQRRRDIYANTGWIEQETALDAFLKEKGGAFTVAAVPWALRGILLAIDLVPLMIKIASPATIYGQRQRDRAALIRYRDAGRDAVERERIERETRLGRDRERLHHDELALRAKQRREAGAP